MLTRFAASLLAFVFLLNIPGIAQDFTPVGSLELDAQTKGTFFLDGQKKTGLLEGKKETIQGIPVGMHVVEVTGSGGKLSFQQVVEIKQGKTTTVTLTEDPALANTTYYSNAEDFTANYRNPLAKAKKEETELIARFRQQVANQQFDAARQTLAAWLVSDADNPIPNYFQGTLFLEEARTQEDPARKAALQAQAKKHLEMGTKKTKPFAYSFAGMAMYHAQRLELKDVFYNASVAEQLDGEDTQLLLSIADAYMASRSQQGITSATRLLTKASASAPDNANILIATGDAYHAQGIAEIPQNYYEQAIAKEAQNFQAYYKLGVYLLSQKNYAEANTALLKSIEINKDFAPAYVQLGELYYLARRYEDATNYYKQYIQLRGNDLVARYRYTIFLYLTKDYKTAVSEIQTVLQDTTTAIMLRLLAYCAVESGDIAVAKNAFQRYVDTWQPNELIAKDYEYRGKIKLAEGDLDSGADDVITCYKLDPSRTDLIIYLVVFFGQEKKDYARAATYQAMRAEVDPRDFVYSFWAKLLKFAKKPEEARAVYTTMTEKFPENVEAWAELGDMQWADDRAASESGESVYNAKPFYDKVIELANPEDKNERKYLVTAYFYQAYLAYLVDNDREKAITYCDKCLELDPSYTTAADLKDQINKELGR